MAATLVSRTTHKATVPWADVEKAIADNAEKMLATRPRLTVSQGIGNPYATLTLGYEISPQKLDEMLRASLPGLPVLGLYIITVVTDDKSVAFEVSWAEEEASTVQL